MNTVEITNSLKNVLPEWAIEQVLEDIKTQELVGNEIDLSYIGNPETSPYQVIDLHEATERCSEAVDTDDEDEAIAVIEEFLEGYLDTNYDGEYGVEFLVVNR